MYMPENCNLEDVAHIKKFVDIAYRDGISKHIKNRKIVVVKYKEAVIVRCLTGVLDDNVVCKERGI